MFLITYKIEKPVVSLTISLNAMYNGCFIFLTPLVFLIKKETLILYMKAVWVGEKTHTGSVRVIKDLDTMYHKIGNKTNFRNQNPVYFI